MLRRIATSTWGYSLVAFGLLASMGCGTANSGGPSTQNRFVGQTEFHSTVPGATRNNGSFAVSAGTGGGAALAPTVSDSSTPTRTVEETDLYRLDGTRLYYLNSYRGLMVFDVTNVDQPRLLGRSPIFGSPVEMVVHNGVASVVVADWYGTDSNGAPFYGSIVRGIDASDPANMKIVGEAQLGGWVRDTRVVGDVLYAVSDNSSYNYGFGYAYGYASIGAPGTYQSSISVASVNIQNGTVSEKAHYDAPGSSGIFNVTPNSILLAHTQYTTDASGNQVSTGNTELRYVDISDPAGAIAVRGSVTFQGVVEGWGADNGRWNLDFADGVTAHAIGCSGSYGYCDGTSPLVLATADFSNPDQPSIESLLSIPSTGWSPTARFDAGRMYLTPGDGYYDASAQGLPLQIYDLTDPKAPRLAGATTLSGQVYNFFPAGTRLFALGSDYDPTGTSSSNQITLRYFDVTDASNPLALGSSSFGSGWAWTPAAGTFKAFTMDQSKGLVVLPFSGWDTQTGLYNNGLQLIEFTPQSISTSGTAHTKGWVERGIFVGSRLLSLSDLALSVVDYSDRQNPKIVNELTLARNVVDAHPLGTQLVELSTDWWGNDVDHSTLRVLPTAQADELTTLDASSSSLNLAGVGATAFHNGSLIYVVTSVRSLGPCDGTIYQSPDANGQCQSWHQHVQVVDDSSGSAILRGELDLPAFGYYYPYFGGYFGCFYWDWYFGADVVQVAGDALAFRRWTPQYDSSGSYVDAYESLFIVDLSKPDAPSLGSAVITRDPNAWWGNMRAFGSQLFTAHYEWEQLANNGPGTYGGGDVVRYYLDRINLDDRAHPYVENKVNVPGMLVGVSSSDPATVYTVDYRYFDGTTFNDFDVVTLSGDQAVLRSTLSLPGWVGNTFVRGDKAYMSVQDYDTTNGSSSVRLLELDLTNPSAPRELATPAVPGWGWLVGVEGDRALVTSGWYNQGIDVYKLPATGAPVYDQFVRTLGWGTSSLARQDNDLFLTSGYWGTQVVQLQQ